MKAPGGRGRHRALGDARMTAAVLLNLLPSPDRQGIANLAQLESVPRKVPPAKLVY